MGSVHVWLGFQHPTHGGIGIEGIETVPDSVEVQAVKAEACFCSNNTWNR